MLRQLSKVLLGGLLAMAFAPAVQASGPEIAVSDFYESGHARLAYRSYGAGQPVVLVAGGPGLSSTYLDPVARLIAGLARRAIVLDLRGLGMSKPASLEGNSLAIGMEDLEALRAALGVRTFALLGHSFGGALVQAYAERHPGCVERLILLDSVGTAFIPPPNPRLAESWKARLTPEEKSAYDSARARGDIDTACRLKFLASVTDPTKARAFVDQLPSPLIDKVVYEKMSADYRASCHVGRSTAAFPVYVIYGADDWIRAWQPQITAAYQGAEVALVAGSGHFPWIENPRGVAECLRRAFSLQTDHRRLVK